MPRWILGMDVLLFTAALSMWLEREFGIVPAVLVCSVLVLVSWCAGRYR